MIFFCTVGKNVGTASSHIFSVYTPSYIMDLILRHYIKCWLKYVSRTPFYKIMNLYAFSRTMVTYTVKNPSRTSEQQAVPKNENNKFMFHTFFRPKKRWVCRLVVRSSDIRVRTWSFGLYFSPVHLLRNYYQIDTRLSCTDCVFQKLLKHTSMKNIYKQGELNNNILYSVA